MLLSRGDRRFYCWHHWIGARLVDRRGFRWWAVSLRVQSVMHWMGLNDPAFTVEYWTWQLVCPVRRRRMLEYWTEASERVEKRLLSY